jgi:hypothetical protein
VRFFSFPRIYRLPIQLGNDELVLDVVFYRSNSSVDIKPALKLTREITGVFKVNKFTNISESDFVTAHLNIESLQTKHLDVENQFQQIKINSGCTLFSNETILLGKTKTENGEYFQKLQIFLFVYGYDLFILCERHFVNTNEKKKIVKTVGALVEYRGRLND